MSTHAAAVKDDETVDRRFDGPWLRVLTAAVAIWVVLYTLEWVLLEAGTPAGAVVGFTHAYVIAPLATATILLDALSLHERGLGDLGLFKWLYALVALFAPPIAVVYYAHREWLKPSDTELLDEPDVRD